MIFLLYCFPLLQSVPPSLKVGSTQFSPPLSLAVPAPLSLSHPSQPPCPCKQSPSPLGIVPSPLWAAVAHLRLRMPESSGAVSTVLVILALNVTISPSGCSAVSWFSLIP